MRAFAIFLIRCYRALISPLFGQCCRFHPSCSEYAMEAVQSHGALKGVWLSLRRVLRCHPFSDGGYDPVPPVHHRCRHHRHG